MVDRGQNVESQKEIPQEQPQERSDQGERLVTPEFGVEKKVPEEGIEKVGEGKVTEKVREPATVAPAPLSRPAPPEKSETLEEIEDIMEDGLEDIYAHMTAEKQQEFKVAGEEAATKIERLLKEAKAKVKKIVEVIQNWLKAIPGVNKYFLDQEAKLKADRIMEIREENGTQVSDDQNNI